MAEVTRARQGQMIEAVLTVLRDEPEGLSVHDTIDRVRKILPPTPYESSEYPNSPGVERFGNIIRFTTISPVKAGWLVKNKGTWTITEAGKEVIGKFSDSADLMREAVRLYRKWKSAQPAEDDEDQPEEDGQEEVPAVALELAEESAWREIFSYLTALPPYDFQQLVADLLSAMEYHIVWVAPPGPDPRCGHHCRNRPPRRIRSTHQGPGEATPGQGVRRLDPLLHGSPRYQRHWSVRQPRRIYVRGGEGVTNTRDQTHHVAGCPAFGRFVDRALHGTA